MGKVPVCSGTPLCWEGEGGGKKKRGWGVEEQQLLLERLCLHVVMKRTRGGLNCVEAKSFGFVFLMIGLTDPPGPLSSRLFFSMVQNSWPPLCTRRNVPADSLGPRCHSCPQAFQRCSESLLHLSLCWQSATEASFSLQFLWAPVTPPREDKETHPVAAAPANHVEGSRSLGHKGFEPQSGQKGT